MTSTAGRPCRRSVVGLVLFVLALLTALATPPTEAAAAAPTPATAPVVLTTVPAVAGFPVTLDGVTVLTDGQGKASFEDAPVSDRALGDRVTLTEATLPIGGQQVLVRADRVYPSSREPLLAVDMSYLVTFGFSGIEGSPVDASSIEAFSVKSETGEKVEVTPGEAEWLQGSRVIKRTEGMEVKDLRWSVQRVEFAGSNVVNAAQQEFFPAQQQDVDVQLLFYGLDLQVHDAIFGFSQDGAIELRYPDGTTRRFPLDDAGRLSVPELPRGDYTLSIVGPGPEMTRPLAVSRYQSEELAFYSWLDIATVLGAVLGAAGALPWVGRVRRRRDTADVPENRGRRGGFRRRHGARGEPAAGSASDEDAVPAEHVRGQLAG
jgi:hypothetical protein